MMFWNGDHIAWWGWLLMSFGMVLFWGLIIVGFILLLRAVSNSDPGRGPGPATAPPMAAPRPTPEQILAERLARGEIDPTEYAERLTALHRKVNGKALT